MIYLLNFLLCFTISLADSRAQNPIIKLFPQGAPNEQISLKEKQHNNGNKIGGKTVLRITDVSTPTLTIYPAKADLATETAIIVCPGGGYNILAYDLEGTEICEWLNNQGITACLLKYRVPRRTNRLKHEAPLEDLQQAIRYIRIHANNLHIKSNQIGVIGFSAGAHLAAMASNCFTTKSDSAIEAKESINCRPDFCMLIYPAYLDGTNFQVAKDIHVSSETPPTFLIQAEDDENYINSSLFYYYALKANKVPAELHLYSSGGHGYGIRNTAHPVNECPYRAITCLSNLGLLNKL